jgi:predicted RNase H-like HicB family nuclease
MLRKEIILNTAVSYWSAEDKCYVVESPLFPPVIAAEKTPEKALQLYKSMLNNAYKELVADNVHGFKRGRPAKHGVELHVQVHPDTKQLIDDLRKEIGISQGEFIDLVTFYYTKKAQPVPFKTDLSLETTISELLNMLPKQKSFALPRQKIDRNRNRKK